MIGERLCTLRNERELTMKELGLAIGVSDSAVNKYEKNKSEPSYKTLAKIANFFGVSIDFLFGRTNIRDVGLIDKTNITSVILREFEESRLGDPYKMISFTTSLNDALLQYNSEYLNEKEMNSLLQLLNEIILVFNGLVEITRNSDDNRYLQFYQSAVIDILSRLNTMSNSIHNNGLKND